MTKDTFTLVIFDPGVFPDGWFSLGAAFPEKMGISMEIPEKFNCCSFIFYSTYVLTYVTQTKLNYFANFPNCHLGPNVTMEGWTPGFPKKRG